jgi:hypothetical protein
LLALLVRESVDEVIFARVTEFLAYQPLQESVIGLQFLNALLELRVIGEQLVAHAGKLNPMLAQNEQIPRTHWPKYAVEDQRTQDHSQD